MSFIRGFLIVLFLSTFAFAGEYKLHGADGLVQKMNTKGVFNPEALQKDANEYRIWLAEGNKPDSADPVIVFEVNKDEQKIKAEMRKMAIEKLKERGELPTEYK